VLTCQEADMSLHGIIEHRLLIVKIIIVIIPIINNSLIKNQVKDNIRININICLRPHRMASEIIVFMIPKSSKYLLIFDLILLNIGIIGTEDNQLTQNHQKDIKPNIDIHSFRMIFK